MWIRLLYKLMNSNTGFQTQLVYNHDLIYGQSDDTDNKSSRLKVKKWADYNVWAQSVSLDKVYGLKSTPPPASAHLFPHLHLFFKTLCIHCLISRALGIS